MVQRHHRTAMKPLDAAGLNALALTYVGRYATTRGKLVRYLARKLRERGAEEGNAPDPEDAANLMVAYGYVNDADFAQNRADALLARGYGERRVRGVLGQAGIERDIVDQALPHDAERARQAAETYARRRKFGPYANNPVDQLLLRKQLAAMIRAGHDFALARVILKGEHP